MSMAKKKLIAAIFVALLALSMLATASYAWYTISTNPEIKGMSVKLYTARTLIFSETLGEKEHWDDVVDISNQFGEYEGLRPVSTKDGINWYLPKYIAGSGMLDEVKNFILDDELRYANVFYSDTDTDEEHYRKENESYYVYGDFWMKTQEEEGCYVRVSIPHVGVTEQIIQDEVKERKDGGNYWAFGSYVLSPFQKLGDQLVQISNEVETSIRIGFLIYEPTEEELKEYEDKLKLYEDEKKKPEAERVSSIKCPDITKMIKPSKFVIYEPNSDERSAIGVKPTGDGEYVKDYTYDTENFIDDKYIRTQPIGCVALSPIKLKDLITINLLAKDADGDDIIYYTSVDMKEKAKLEAKPEENNLWIRFSKTIEAEEEDEEDIVNELYVQYADLTEKTLYAYYSTGSEYAQLFLRTAKEKEDEPEVYEDVYEPVEYGKEWPETVYRYNEESYSEIKNYNAENVRYKHEDIEKYYKKEVIESTVYFAKACYNVGTEEENNFVQIYTRTKISDDPEEYEYKEILFRDDVSGLTEAFYKTVVEHDDEEDEIVYVQVASFDKDSIVYKFGNEDVDEHYLSETEIKEADGYIKLDDGYSRVYVEVKNVYDAKEGDIKVAEIMEYDVDKLAIQKTSKWDNDKVAERDGNVDSSCLSELGQFLDTEVVYSELDKTADKRVLNTKDNGVLIEDCAGSPIVCELEKDRPVMMRMFVWEEGQDVDCWNDVAAGKIFVNIELAGETKAPNHEDDLTEIE